MTTTIKITELADIGNNLANNTLVPVVNMANTPTTERANLNNLSNFVLNLGVGANLGAVGDITITGGTAGQKLTTDGAGGLSWTNDANSSYGNSNVATFLASYGSNTISTTGNITAGNLVGNVSAGNITVANITVNTRANLGAVGNVKITGGTNGYVLQTDGAGNLSWTAQTGGGGGNGTPGGTNTQIQFNDAGSFGGNSGFTFNKTAGALASPKIDTADLYHLAGTVIENADLTHGATAALVIPANGNTSNPVQLTNTYGNIVITTGINSGSLKNWTFDNTGNLTLPANTFAVKYANGTQVSLGGGANLGNLAVDDNNLYNANGQGVVISNFSFIAEAETAYVQIPAGDSTNDLNVVQEQGNVRLVANTAVWKFDTTGNLTLPTNTSSINYANGSPYGGGGANTGNVTFDGNVVQGTSAYTGLGLSASPEDTANLKYLQVRAGDIDSHIHFDTGNYQAYDQYFGDDNKYLKLEKGLAGNVLIGTYQDGGIGQLHWTFDSNGNLVLPENGRIKAAGNTIPFSTTITGITSGSTTVIVTTADNIFPDEYTGQVTISNVNPPVQANGTWWYLAVNNNQFQLYYDQALTAPVDGTSWPGYVDGGDAVSTGSAMTINASNITIDTGLGNSWTFDTAGVISIPQGSASFTKGRIQSANGYPTLLGYGSSPEHGGPELDWMNGDNPNDLGNNSILRNTLYINENGFYVGMNENHFDVANNFSGSWRFGSGGALTIPAGDANNIVSGQIFSDNESSFINLDVQFGSNVLGGVRLGTSATKPVDIVTGNGSGYNTWRFDSNGEIATPDGTLIGNVEGSGTFGFYNANATDFLIEGPNNVTWSFNTGTANTAMPGNVTIGTGNAGVLLKSNSDGYGIDSNITGITNGNPTVFVTLSNVEFPGPASGSVRITGVLGETEANGYWGWQAVDVDVIQLFTDSTLSTPVDGTTWSAYTGGGHAISSGYNNLDIIGGNVAIQSGAGKYWSFNPDGGFVPPIMTIDLHNGGNQQAQLLQLGNPSYQAVITGPTPAVNNNAQRLIIQGQRGNGVGEGGDVYIWAGDSDYNGGDIKIYAGDSDGATGGGGYINLAGGQGADTGGYINIDGGYSSNGSGGYINITGGRGANSFGGAINLQGGWSDGIGIDGANILLQGGYSQTANGGPVIVRGGSSGLGLSGYGNVLVQAGASSWTFDNGGNLTVPGEGIIQSIDDTVILRSVDANSNIYSARLGTNGGLYFETTAYPTGWLSLTNNSGNANITAATGTAGGAGKHIIINAGDADQSDFYTSAGGNINIKGGLGAFNDGGGGGPGGSINLIAGNSSDPSGVSGNINITSGPNVWSFNNVGQLVAIGDVGNSIPNLVIGGGSEPFISSDLIGGPGNLGLISNYLNLSGYTGAKISMYADDGEIAGDGNLVLKSNNTGTVNSWTFDTTGNLTVPGSIVYSSNVYTTVGFTLSTLNDIGGQVDYNNRTMGYVADNNGTASLYARDSAGLGNHNAVITANGASGTALIRTSNEALVDYDWTFGSAGTLTLPTINLGTGLDAQAIISSQRKLIPPFRYSAVIDGNTPTVVYNATDVNTTSMKVTMQIQHAGLGMEFFEVFATFTGSDTYYTIGNRVSPPTIDASTVVVGLGTGSTMKITVTINSGATTSWVTYDAVEFGIAVD